MRRLLLAPVAIVLLAACDRPATHPPAHAASAVAPAKKAGLAAVIDSDGVALVDSAIDQLLGDHAAYRRVFDAFQQAVAAKDAKAVASLVDYPFTARIGGRKETIADADAFVAQYDRIVTPSIARVIDKQAYGALFVNEQGVMLGRGEVWINGICRDGDACKAVDVRVVAIQPTLQ